MRRAQPAGITSNGWTGRIHRIERPDAVIPGAPEAPTLPYNPPPQAGGMSATIREALGGVTTTGPPLGAPIGAFAHRCSVHRQHSVHDLDGYPDDYAGHDCRHHLGALAALRA